MIDRSTVIPFVFPAVVMIDRSTVIPFVFPAVVAIIIVALIVHSHFSVWRREAKWKQRLIASGRCIEGSQAIAAFRDGEGRILYNDESSLPGRWWFIDADHGRVDHGLVSAVEEYGLLIHPLTKEVIQALEEIEESIEVLPTTLED